MVSLLMGFKRELMIILIAILVWFAVVDWANGQKIEAIEDTKRQINSSTIKRVKEDERTVSATYSRVTSGMRARADARVQQYKAIQRDRLQRVVSSKGTANVAKRVKNLDGSNVLSDKEITAIRKNADLLQ